ncbi:unnamed protein product [Closterium sp. Yama58-4]|nr:unnamed protein product [Closterium sp. Yama58-4]
MHPGIMTSELLTNLFHIDSPAHVYWKQWRFIPRAAPRVSPSRPSASAAAKRTPRGTPRAASAAAHAEEAERGGRKWRSGGGEGAGEGVEGTLAGVRAAVRWQQWWRAKGMMAVCCWGETRGTGGAQWEPRVWVFCSNPTFSSGPRPSSHHQQQQQHHHHHHRTRGKAARGVRGKAGAAAAGRGGGGKVFEKRRSETAASEGGWGGDSLAMKPTLAAWGYWAARGGCVSFRLHRPPTRLRLAHRVAAVRRGVKARARTAGRREKAGIGPGEKGGGRGSGSRKRGRGGGVRGGGGERMAKRARVLGGGGLEGLAGNSKEKPRRKVKGVASRRGGASGVRGKGRGGGRQAGKTKQGRRAAGARRTGRRRVGVDGVKGARRRKRVVVMGGVGHEEVLYWLCEALRQRVARAFEAAGYVEFDGVFVKPTTTRSQASHAAAIACEVRVRPSAFGLLLHTHVSTRSLRALTPADFSQQRPHGSALPVLLAPAAWPALVHRPTPPRLIRFLRRWRVEQHLRRTQGREAPRGLRAAAVRTKLGRAAGQGLRRGTGKAKQRRSAVGVRGEKVVTRKKGTRRVKLLHTIGKWQNLLSRRPPTARLPPAISAALQPPLPPAAGPPTFVEVELLVPVVGRQGRMTRRGRGAGSAGRVRGLEARGTVAGPDGGRSMVGGGGDGGGMGEGGQRKGEGEGGETVRGGGAVGSGGSGRSGQARGGEREHPDDVSAAGCENKAKGGGGEAGTEGGSGAVHVQGGQEGVMRVRLLVDSRLAMLPLFHPPPLHLLSSRIRQLLPAHQPSLLPSAPNPHLPSRQPRPSTLPTHSPATAAPLTAAPSLHPAPPSHPSAASIPPASFPPSPPLSSLPPSLPLALPHRLELAAPLSFLRMLPRGSEGGRSGKSMGTWQVVAVGRGEAEGGGDGKDGESGAQALASRDEDGQQRSKRARTAAPTIGLDAMREPDLFWSHPLNAWFLGPGDAGSEPGGEAGGGGGGEGAGEVVLGVQQLVAVLDEVDGQVVASMRAEGGVGALLAEEDGDDEWLGQVSAAGTQGGVRGGGVRGRGDGGGVMGEG